MLEEEPREEEELKKFIEEWLINRTGFYASIKRLRLGTFALMKKTVKVKTSSKIVQFSTQSDIFDKVSVN